MERGEMLIMFVGITDSTLLLQVSFVPEEISIDGVFVDVSVDEMFNRVVVESTIILCSGQNAEKFFLCFLPPAKYFGG